MANTKYTEKWAGGARHKGTQVARLRRCLLSLVGLALLGCALVNRADPADKTVEFVARTAQGTVAERAGGADAVRIVTYNVHGLPAAALWPAFRDHQELSTADVILLQEIESYSNTGASEASELASLLGMSHAYAPGYGIGNDGSHGVAILSRFPLSAVELVELPRYHLVVNSARRVALGATVTVGEQSLRVYSVHLDNRINPSDRRAQLAPVLAHAADMPESAVIIGGDLNTSPFCWVGHVVPVPCRGQSRTLEQLARRAGFQTPTTSSGPTSKWLGMRLDSFYSRGVEARNVIAEANLSLSDHWPLRMDVRIIER